MSPSRMRAQLVNRRAEVPHLCPSKLFSPRAKLDPFLRGCKGPGAIIRPTGDFFFQCDRQRSVKISCNVTKWSWSSNRLQAESKLKGNDLYLDYSFSFIAGIFHLLLYLSDTFRLQGKTEPEGCYMDQISFLQKGPLYFSSKTHRGASFVTGAASILNFALC